MVLTLDNDGLGSGDSYELCNGLDLTGWVLNGDDGDDNCADQTSMMNVVNVMVIILHVQICAGTPNGDNTSCADDCGCP